MPERNRENLDISPLPDSEKGSGRFSWKRAMVTIIGANLGGMLLEQMTKHWLADSLNQGFLPTVGMLSWTVGAIIFGLVIPNEINRRIDRLGFMESYRRKFTS